MRVASWLVASFLVLTGASLSAPAGAVGLGAIPQAGMRTSDGLLEPVRWERRCHREMVRTRDQFGRRIMVPQRVCTRVWVGPRRY